VQLCDSENIRLTNCKAFDSKSIQQLLCSAQNLRRFDSISSRVRGEVEPYSLMAMDVAESTEDWVCLGLEAFRCYIGGVPRPDITSKNNGRPLTGIYNISCRYSVLECCTIQRRVLPQLGRLTRLREITLGKDVIDEQSEAKFIYYSYSAYELGSQYQCLAMSLQDGLDELKDLKCLRRLTLEKMSLGMGEAEQRWMKENWPEYGRKSKDTFWTSRGHSVTSGTTLHYEKLHNDLEAQVALTTYDWW